MNPKPLPFLYTRTDLHTALAEYTMTQVGTAFMLALYCARTLNAGIIKNCRNWTPQQWRARTGIEHPVRSAIPGLWTWNGDDLAVLLYDPAMENKARNTRRRASQAAQARRNSPHGKTLSKPVISESSQPESGQFSEPHFSPHPKIETPDTPQPSLTPNFSNTCENTPAPRNSAPSTAPSTAPCTARVHCTEQPSYREHCEPQMTKSKTFAQKIAPSAPSPAPDKKEERKERKEAKESKERRKNPPQESSSKEKENKEKESPAPLPPIAEASMSPPSYLPDTSAYPSLPQNAGEVMAYLRAIPTLAMDTDTLADCAESFFNTAEGRGWTDRYSAPILNWHGIAREYARRWQVNHPYPTASPKAPAHTPQALQTPSPRRDTLTRYIPPADTPAAAMSPAVRESCRNFAAEIASLMADFTPQPQTDPPPLPDSPP